MVLANPPYSIKQWNREAFAPIPMGEIFMASAPGTSRLCIFPAYYQEYEPQDGTVCDPVPARGIVWEDEKSMREKMVADDIIECVLGLGPNLFYNATMEACVIICRMLKSTERKGRILFINAVNEVTTEKTQSFIEDHHRKKSSKHIMHSRTLMVFQKLLPLMKSKRISLV